VRKEDHVLPWLRRMSKNDAYGVYFIFKSMEQGAAFRVTVPKYPTADPNYRILAHQRHYYFYIRDEVLGPMVMRVASFFPFQATYYLNGHSFIERELTRAHIGLRKNDNAFLAVDDVAALQAAANRLSPDIIRRRLDYWTFLLGPKFSAKERKQINLSRFYAIAQIEYCRNFIFKRNSPIHKLFERSCELGLWRLTADKIAAIFGTRLTRRHRGKLATVIDRIEYGHHVFRAYFKSAFLKQYEKFSTFLRNELCSNNLTDFGLRKGLDQRRWVIPPTPNGSAVYCADRRQNSAPTITPGLSQHPQPISEANLLDQVLPETTRTHDLHKILQSCSISYSGWDLGAVEVGSKADAVLTNMFENVIEVLDQQLSGCVRILTTVGAEEAGSEVNADNAAGFTDCSQLLVGEISRMGAQSVRVGMRGDEGRVADGGDVPEPPFIKVRQID
jgi:hypothetical protein